VSMDPKNANLANELDPSLLCLLLVISGCVQQGNLSLHVSMFVSKWVQCIGWFSSHLLYSWSHHQLVPY